MASSTSTTAKQDPGKAISSLVAEYQRQTKAPGVVVSVYAPDLLEPNGHVFPFGVANLLTQAPVVADTVFELGSVTKVFTSLLTAYAILNPPAGQQPSLTDPVLKYLTAYGVKGSKALGDITLADLATHTSGMPDEGPASASRELFADAAPSAALMAYWNSYKRRKPAACWLYSNIAFVTLGFSVSQLFSPESNRASNSYNQLLGQLVTMPLGMHCTSASPSTSDCPFVAKGYKTAENKPSNAQAFDLKSTGRDMLTFLRANLGAMTVPAPLASAIALTQTRQGQYPICGKPGRSMAMGLGWQMPTVEGQTMYYKNGATGLGGFSCAVEFLPEANVGIAVLTNQCPNKTAGTNSSNLAARIRNVLNPGLPGVVHPLETGVDEDL